MGAIPSRGGTTGGGSGGGGGGGGGASYLERLKSTVSYPSGIAETTMYEYLNTSAKSLRCVGALTLTGVFTAGRIITARTWRKVNGSYTLVDKQNYTVGSDEVAPSFVIYAFEAVKVTIALDITEGAGKNVPVSIETKEV
jgi:hypothetical protein